MSFVVYGQNTKTINAESKSPQSNSKLTNLEVEPIECPKNEILIIIKNSSNDEMFFENKSRKLQTVIKPKTNKNLCVHKGDIIGGYVKQIKIEKKKIPNERLMWYTERVRINIDPNGSIDVNTDIKNLPSPI